MCVLYPPFFDPTPCQVRTLSRYALLCLHPTLPPSLIATHSSHTCLSGIRMFEDTL